MRDSIMYDNTDHFVVLEFNQPEQLLTAAELRDKLQSILSTRQDDLPRDLQKYDKLEEQVESLINTSCELEMETGQFLQWYAVRLEK